MSKKSKKEPFASKLDDLFDEIEDLESPDGLTNTEGTSGWVWECDGEKKYTKVSPEAEKIIGIPPNDFLGRHLVDFNIADQFVPDMLKVFKADAFPVQTQIAFSDANNTYQLVTFHIFKNEDKPGWHGFAEALGIPYIPPPQEKKAVAKPSQALPPNQFQKELQKTEQQNIQPSKTQVVVTDDNNNVLSTNLLLSNTDAGVLQIIDDNPDREWTEDDRLLVSQVADQLGLALENANLFQQTQSALAETDSLYRASAELNAANDYNEVIDVLRKNTIIGQSSTFISVKIFDEPRNNENLPEWLEVLYIWSSLDVAWGNRAKFNAYPSLATLMNRDEILFIENIANDQRLTQQEQEDMLESLKAKSGLFIPLLNGGEWIGYVDVFFGEETTFDEATQRQLTSITSQAMEKFVSIWLNNITVTRRLNADQLNEISRELGELLSLDDVRNATLDHLYDRLNPNVATLYEWDETRRNFFSRNTKSHNLLENLSEMPAVISTTEREDIYEAFQKNQTVYEITKPSISDQTVEEKYLIPWLVGETTAGVIEIRNAGTRAIVDDLAQEFTTGLVLQAGSSMERARLFEQTQSALALTDEQARRLAVLNDLSSALSQAQDRAAIYQLTIEKTHDIFPTERISMTLLDPSRKNVDVVAVYNSEGEESQLTIGQKIAIEGTANETALLDYKVVMESSDNDTEVPSFMVGPLVIGGESIGTLNVGSAIEFFFNDQDVNFMNQLLAVVSSSLENRQLFRAIQESLSTSEEQARRLAELNAMSEALGQVSDLEGVLNMVSQYIQRIIPADKAYAVMFDDAKNIARVHTLDREKGVVAAEAELPISSTLAHEIGQQADIKIINQYTPRQIELYTDVELMSAEGIRGSILAPLLVAGKAIGAINVSSTASDAFTERERTLMQSISALLASTIDNRQLLTQIQRRSVQLEASAEVSRVASTILDTNELLPRVVDLIREGFGLYYCGMFLVDELGAWTGEPGKWAVLQAGTGQAGEAMLNIGHKLEIGGTSMIGGSIKDNEARIALDVGAEAEFFRNPYLPNTRSEMALPLLSRGVALGALTIQSEDEAAFSEEDITALQTLADQVANTIENARLFEQTESRAEELTVLNEMARAFTQTLDVDTVVTNTYAFTARLIEANNFYLALYDDESNLVEFKIFIEDGEAIPPPEPVLKLGTGLTDWIINNKIPMLIPSNIDERLLEIGIEPRGQTASSWLGVPMLRGNVVLGVIAVQSYTTSNAYGPHQQGLLSAVANQASIAIENARLFQGSQARAKREQLLREIAARVHSSADPDIILRTAVREVSNALGRKAYIKLGDSDTKELKETQPTETNGAGTHKTENVEILENNGTTQTTE